MWILKFHIWFFDFHTLHVCPFTKNTTLHYAWWFDMTDGNIWPSDNTCTHYKLTMTAWSPWWGTNAKLFSLLLCLSYSLKMFSIVHIYERSSLLIIFTLQKVFDQYWTLPSHHAMSSFCHSLGFSSSIHDSFPLCLFCASYYLCLSNAIFLENLLIMLWKWSWKWRSFRKVKMSL